MTVKKATKGASSASEDRLRVIKARLAGIGLDESVVHLGGEIMKYLFIPLGIQEVDNLLTAPEGIGIPAGTMVEFAGESMSGKTFAAYHHMAEHQKLGRRAAFMDIENTYFAPRAKAIGVQVDNPNLFEHYDNVGTAEKWGSLILKMVQSGEYGIIVIDSIKAMIPSKEYSKDMGDTRQTMAFPVFIRDFLNRLNNALAATRMASEKDPTKLNTTVVLVNHTVVTSGTMPGTFVKSSSGGSSVAYLTHQRIQFTKIGGAKGSAQGKVDGKVQQIGGRSKADIKKSRFGAPEGECEFIIPFGDYESNPIIDFLFCALASKEPSIRREGRSPNYTYKFIDPTTGEIMVEAYSEFEFIEELIVCDPPNKKNKNDNSENAFDYVTKQLRWKKDTVDALLAKMDSIRLDPAEEVFTPPSLDDVFDMTDTILAE